MTVLSPTRLEQMRADAVLPPDVRPAAAPAAATGTVLLTGATGFVGAHLLAALLRETPAAVLCLVRRDRRGLCPDPVERIRANLEAHALWEPAWAGRIRCVTGDLRQEGLGWGEALWQQLAEGVEGIYHCGAAVNWVAPYAGLRGANVLGTLSLLRLACRARAKPFHFLSTLGVCYALGERVLAEHDDAWPLLDRLHLGYAESKLVAEELVRQARQRGLPAVIYRPALITGDSGTGLGNPVDFLSRGLGACVRMGCAPDVDWHIDACPVDHVARVVARHAMTPASPVLHLLHPQPRHWRELVLWMQMSGYPLRLISYRAWLRRLERTARSPRHPLHPLLGFFRTRVGGVTLPETYLGGARSRVSAERTRQTLTALGETCPTLDARWLERFFAALTAQGVVPPGPRPARPGGGSTASWEDDLPDLLRRHFDDPALHVRPLGAPQRLSRQSILTELTSWRCGSEVGLFRQHLQLHSARPGIPGLLDVVVKMKAGDSHVLDVAEAAAALCDASVGEALARWRERLGLAGGRREIALYEQHDERWLRFTPRVYGTAWDANRHHGWVVLEDLSAGVWMDPCEKARLWRPAQIEAAVRGLAELHAIWFERRDELAAQPWLGPVFTAAGVAEMTDLWKALAGHAARYFAAWLGPEVRRVQRRLLARLEHWWRPLGELPQTLIHNDFNPRNLALRQRVGGWELCAYDWELATLSIPQHDLAELLCFVLPDDVSRGTTQHYLDLHRQELERATGRRLAADDWQRGFALALADLLLNRLALLTLVHAVRRLPFLERVVQTWRTLYEDFDPLE